MTSNRKDPDKTFKRIFVKTRITPIPNKILILKPINTGIIVEEIKNPKRKKNIKRRGR